jgi:hypothetical protein
MIRILRRLVETGFLVPRADAAPRRQSGISPRSRSDRDRPSRGRAP